MRCLRCKSGFTLIEVVVGLVIMAGVLASSLLAFASHQRARRLTDAKLVAVDVADDMLTAFSGSRGGIPPAGRGPVIGRSGWWWQTAPIGVAAPAGVPVTVTRFQIIEIEASGKTNSLVQVDVVGAGI